MNSRYFTASCDMIVMLVSLIVASFIAGCSARSERSDTEIVFWHAMGGRLGTVLAKIVTDFNEQNPDISIKTEYMGSYSTLRQKLIASLAAGNFPDMAQSFETWTTKFVESRRILPISDFFNGPHGLTSDQIEDICPVFRQAVSYHGQLWAMPFNKSVPVVYYNASLFEEAGLVLPEDGWTWDDFLNMARILTIDKDNDGEPERYGFATTLSEWLFQCMLQQQGSGLFDIDERKSLFDTPVAISTLTWLINLSRTEKVAYYSTGFNQQNDFAAGKVAMIISSCASRIYLEPVIRFAWNCAPLPQYDKPGASVSGTDIVIFRSENARRMEGAWRFVRYFSSPEVTRRWSINSGYLPVRTSAIKSPEMREAMKHNPKIIASIIQLPTAGPAPRNEAWTKGREILLAAIEEVFIGKLPPSSALTAANQQTQSLLDRYTGHR